MTAIVSVPVSSCGDGDDDGDDDGDEGEEAHPLAKMSNMEATTAITQR